MTATSSHSPPITTLSRYQRMQIRPVPTRPATGSECGFTSYARDLTTTLCATYGGTTRQAATRHLAAPHPLIDRRSDVLVMVAGHHLVTVGRWCPAGSDRDMWSIRVNGRPMPHRTFPAPHADCPAAGRHASGTP